MFSTFSHRLSIQLKRFSIFLQNMFKVVCCRIVISGKGLNNYLIHNLNPCMGKGTRWIFRTALDSCQPVHPHSLIKIYTVRVLRTTNCFIIIIAMCVYSDETVQVDKYDLQQTTFKNSRSKL